MLRIYACDGCPGNPCIVIKHSPDKPNQCIYASEGADWSRWRTVRLSKFFEMVYKGEI
ncbi:hypothetical protein [Geoglobus ahangari]